MSTTGDILLDTSVVIAHLRGDQAITQLLNEANTLFLPWVVLGELRYGALRSRAHQAGLAQISDFKKSAVLLFADEETVEEYATIKLELSFSGRLIPENDIWIAALARRHGLALATRDQHFANVPRLGVVPGRLSG